MGTNYYRIPTEEEMIARKERPNDRMNWLDYSKHYDCYVDGLRVSSSTDFS